MIKLHGLKSKANSVSAKCVGTYVTEPGKCWLEQRKEVQQQEGEEVRRKAASCHQPAQCEMGRWY